MTEVTKKIRIDLANQGGLDFLSTIHAVQGDAYSRLVAFELYNGGEKYTPPEGTTAIVRYRKEDGTRGNYDVLPDGSSAYTINGNMLTVALAPQLCIVPGLVQLAVGLISGNAEINTFSVRLVVQPNPGITYQSESHLKLAGTVADSGWEPNMYLGTDADGNVTALGTDKTLTQPGRAADAKATGDAVGQLKEDLVNLKSNTIYDNYISLPNKAGENDNYINYTFSLPIGTYTLELHNKKPNGQHTTRISCNGSYVYNQAVNCLEYETHTFTTTSEEFSIDLYFNSYFDVYDCSIYGKSIKINLDTTRTNLALLSDDYLNLKTTQFTIDKNFNIFDGYWEKGNLDLNGLEIESSYKNSRTKFIDITFSDYYNNVIVLGSNTDDTYYYLYQYDENKLFISRDGALSNVGRKGLASNCKYIRIATFDNDSTSLIEINDFFITYSTSTEFAPKLQFIYDEYKIPSYYFDNLYLQNKIKNINNIASLCGGSGDVFLFITDIHYERNARQSDKLIKYISDNTNINFMVNGGDMVDGVSPRTVRTFENAFNGKMYNVIGNHELMGEHIQASYTL